MIMSAFYLKALFPVSIVGLLAAAEMELGSWAQLGVAGVSLGILFWVVTKTLPDVVEKIMKGHAAANEAVLSKLDEVKGELAAGRKDQLDLLREAIKK